MGGYRAGDPTEVALLLAAARGGLDKAPLEARMPRIAELPFSSERARMTTLHRDGTAILAFTKGAPERVLDGCVHRLSETGIQPFDPGAVLAAATDMADRGLRVLAVAYRRLEEVPEADSLGSVESGQTRPRASSACSTRHGLRRRRPSPSARRQAYAS